MPTPQNRAASGSERTAPTRAAIGRRRRRIWRPLLAAAGIACLLALVVPLFYSGPAANRVRIVIGGITLVIGVVYALLAISHTWRRATLHAAAWRTFRCTRCNYDLRGAATPVCPECGTYSPALSAWLADSPHVLRALRSDEADAAEPTSRAAPDPPPDGGAPPDPERA